MDILYIAVVLVVIFVSMTLHELAHGLVANSLGDRTAYDFGRLTLNPIKHIDLYMTILLPMIIIVTNMTTGASMPIFGGAKPVPFDPSNVKHGEIGVALVAISGPLVNFFLAFLAYTILAISKAEVGSLLNSVLTVFTMVNLGFFAFNIIPIPPLDGSRVLYALAPDFARNIFDVIERYGVLLIFAILMVGGSLIVTYMNFIIVNILKGFSIVFGG